MFWWFRIILFILCYASTLSLPETEKSKQKGDVRRSCSKTGLPLDPQPMARVNTTLRLDAIREKMENEKIHAYIIISYDEHMNYEVNDYDKRLEYISGFSGTYAVAVITHNTAALWTDSRYHHQADEQIDCNWLLFRDGLKHSSKISEWLKKELTKEQIVGVDPKLISEFLWKKLESELKGALYLQAISSNLVDLIWSPNSREQRRDQRALTLDTSVAGYSHKVKLTDVRNELKKQGADAIVITALDEIAWLLNIRGQDLPYSPVVKSYVILDMEKVYLYVNTTKYNNSIELEDVISNNYGKFWMDLKELSQKYTSVLIPSHCVYNDGASHAIVSKVQEVPTIMFKQSPIIYLKSMKNKMEIIGMEETAIKDAAILCEFLAELEEQIKGGDIITEQDVVTRLTKYRTEKGWLDSFQPIVSFGLNSAHPFHRILTNQSSTIFTNNSLIIESGVHYFNETIAGTTEIIRTFFFGEPTEEFKEAYTRVLIGLIQLSTLTFPSNLKMAAADAVTRSSLWEVGMDYFHESSHGIGAYLNVRESPILMRFDSETSAQQVFKPGYFLSSEPAVYIEGEFGVKLGNVLEVVEKSWLKQNGHTFLGFKTVSLLPFESHLFKLSILSTQQRQWLNSYNERVRQYVGAELKAQKKMNGFYWMMEKTKYIPETGRGSSISGQSIFLLIINIIMFKLFIV